MHSRRRRDDLADCARYGERCRQKRFLGVRPSQMKPGAETLRIDVLKQPPRVVARGRQSSPRRRVADSPEKVRRPSSRTRTDMTAREVGRPAESTAFTVTRAEPARDRYVIEGILSRSGRTCSVAVPETVSAPLLTAGRDRGFAGLAEGRHRGRASRPRRDLPERSAASETTSRTRAACSRTSPCRRPRAEPWTGCERSRTVGVTETEATGPGVTVTVCVPLVAPCADAVSSGLPARVSR